MKFINGIVGVVLGAILTCNFADAFTFTSPCDDEGTECIGRLVNVTVSSCPQPETEERCPLVKGKNTAIEIKFTVGHKVEAVNTKINGKIGAAKIPFPFSKSDACEHGGLQCPLEPDTTHTYMLSLPVLKAYPPIKVEVEVCLLSTQENNANIMCIKFPAKIVADNAS